MNYLEIDCQIIPYSDDSRDLLIYYLGELGFESFTETENGCLAFFPGDNFDSELLNNFNIPEIENVIYQFSPRLIPKVNWNEEWEKNFQPIQIKDKIRIRANFHEPDSTFIYEIIINPKMSFGTGHHETTSLVMAEMLENNFTKKRVLDMGCGTGILAILAAKMGAEYVLAIDNDEWAFQNAIENTEKNDTAQVKVILGDAQLIEYKTFDLILANINLNILLSDIPRYCRALNHKGFLILSGIFFSDLEKLQSKCSEEGLTFCRFTENNHWITVTFSK